MHYFSISAEDGEHLGFFLMDTDENIVGQSPKHGQFAVKTVDELSNKYEDAVQTLLQLESTSDALWWHWQGDGAQLSDHKGTNLGTLCRERLVLCGHTFVLNDMTGML